MDKTINVLEIFKGYKSQELNFHEFKNIFNTHFDINNFIVNKPPENFEGNYKHQLLGQFLNQEQYHRLITSSLGKISQNTNSIENVISKIEPKDILIRSVSLTSCTHAARSLNLELDYCILDVYTVETEYDAYKRIYDYVKNSLEKRN